MGTSGTNLTNGTIKIGDVLADDRLRIGGILYLEEKLGKGFEEIADDLSSTVDSEKLNVSKMIKGIRPFLVALILQRNADMPESEAEFAVGRLELEEFTEVFNQVKMFKSAKNGQAPTSPKPRTRKKVARKRKT